MNEVLERIKGNLSVEAHLRIITRALACKEKFVFTRYSDGELFMLFGKEIKLTENGAWIDGKKVNSQQYAEHDRKTYLPDRDRKIVDMLREAYKYKADHYLIGMPLECCVGKEMFNELKEKEGIPKVYTTSNLLINANYPYFLEKTLKILETREIILIANKRAKTDRIKNLTNFVMLGDDCGHYIDEIIDEVDKILTNGKDQENTVILCAASYMSNLIGHHVAKKFRNITFLDIGTALHPIFGFELSRDYLIRYWSNPAGYTYHQCEIGNG